MTKDSYLRHFLQDCFFILMDRFLQEGTWLEHTWLFDCRLQIISGCCGGKKTIGGDIELKITDSTDTMRL